MQENINHNQFDTCFVSRVFVSNVCDDTVKVLSTIKHLSRRGQMVKIIGFVFEREKGGWFKSGWIHKYISILNYWHFGRLFDGKDAQY